MTYLDKLKAVDVHRTESRHAERICSELTYLDNLSAMYGGEYDDKIEGACELILGRLESDGVITAATVREAEEFLSSLASVAKSKKEIFVGHGHIDMNWRWGYNETAVITVDTFRTMLLLMREYPEFTYARIRKYFGNGHCVAEGIRNEIDLDLILRNAQKPRQVFFSLQNLAGEGLAAGHVLVGLHPLGGGDLPTPLLYSLPDLGEHFRGIFFNYLVG